MDFPRKFVKIASIAFMLSGLLFFSVETTSASIVVDCSPSANFIHPDCIETNTLYVSEDAPIGSVVGTLRVNPPTPGFTFTEQTITGSPVFSGPANFRFDVSANGDIIFVNCCINFEGFMLLNLPVSATDGITTYNTVINIQLTDAPDAPRVNGFTTLLRYERQVDNSPVFYSVGSALVDDEDDGDDLSDLTYEILNCVDSNTDSCLGLFTLFVDVYNDPFSGPTERLEILSPTFVYDSSTPDEYYLTIRATDPTLLSDEGTFTIQNRRIGAVSDVESPQPDAIYGIGEQIEIRVNLDNHERLSYYNQPTFDPFTFIQIDAEQPTLSIDLDNGVREIELQNLPVDQYGSIQLEDGYNSSGPITFLQFLYTVLEDDQANLLEYLNETAIDFKNARLVDYEFGDFGSYYFETGPNHPVVPTDLPTPGLIGSLSFARNIIIDGVRPFIQNALGSGTLVTHGLGDNLDVIVEFSEDIQKGILDGTSTIDLDIGGTIVTADYNTGYTATLLNNQLGFRYTIISGLFDDDGVEVVANSFTPDNIRDLAGNEMLNFTHTSFLLANDLVDSTNAVSPPSPPSGNSGGGSSISNVQINNPFLPPSTPDENQDTVEEDSNDNQTDEQLPTVTDDVISEEEETQEPTNTTNTPEPTQQPSRPTPPAPSQPLPRTDTPIVTDENNDLEESSANGTEEETQEPTNVKPILSIQSDDVVNCEQYNPDALYTSSVSFDCDVTNTYIDKDGPTIQLNLPRDKTNEYSSDDMIITGQVIGERVERVAVYASFDGEDILLGIAQVDEGGRFMIRNKQKLPRNNNIVVFGRDVDSSTSSPDYNLLISQNRGLISVNLDSFTGKTQNQMYKSNNEADFWTFVNVKTVKSGLLEAKVESEFNTYHKAYWQSVLMGSSAIAGSNSNLVTLLAPDEKVIEIKPFSRHRVTIVAERADANSAPLVIEYVVLPNNFAPTVAIVLILLIAISIYLYKKRKSKNTVGAEAKSEVAEVESL